MPLPLPPKADPLKNSPIKKAGLVPPNVVACRVTRVNADKWTVNVVSVFDGHTYDNVPIATPYVHPQGGAGFFIQPLEKASCYVTIPSDSSPPFVSGFVPPLRSQENKASSEQETPETVEQEVALEQAEAQGLVDPTQPKRSSPSFDGNRPPSDEGDGHWRGHTGNFISLYQSGVLALGASPLAQRIYLPLQDRVLDVCREYEMKHPGGGFFWGVATRPKDPILYVQTWRQLADDDYATLRLSLGTVTPLGEPDGDAGESVDLAALQIGLEDTTCWEMSAVSGGKVGFDPEKQGAPSSDEARKSSVFRSLLDNKGGLFLRAAGEALIRLKKGVKLKVAEALLMSAKKWALSADPDEGEGLLNGGAFLKLQGKVIQMNGGDRPASGVGDQVQIVLPSFNISGLLNGQPFTGVATVVAGTARGEIVTGSETFRIP